MQTLFRTESQLKRYMKDIKALSIMIKYHICELFRYLGWSDPFKNILLYVQEVLNHFIVG